MSLKTYEQLKVEVKRLQEQGKLDPWPSREQRIDWAYGTTVIENREVTQAMAEKAVDDKPNPRG